MGFFGVLWTMAKLAFYAGLAYGLYVLYKTIGWEWSLFWLFMIGMTFAITIVMRWDDEQN